MVFWPQLVGGIEIQERRPRSFNEPRRKRLSFVKDRRRSQGEWALVTASSGRNHHESEQELWDRRQFEANQRFLRQQEHQLLMERERFILRQPVPRPQLQSWNPERDRGLDSRMQPLPPPPPGHNHLGERDHHSNHGHHDDRDGGIEVVSSDSDSDSDFDDHHHSPRLIKQAPIYVLPKHFKSKRSKSRGRKDKKKNKKRSSSLFSDGSSSEDDFSEGFRAGRRSMSRRPLSRRGRSRSRVFELSDDSFEDLGLRRRPRSRSRGMKWLR